MELLFKRNENENNQLVSKILLGLAAFIMVIWLLCSSGIFIFNIKAVSLLAGASIVALSIPVLLIYIFHMNRPFMKYLLIGLLSLIMGLCYCIFTFQMIIMFLFPLLVAMLYMNRKLLYCSGIFNLAAVTLAHIETYFYVLQPGMEPFKGMQDIIRFGLIPRVMQLGVCFLILVILMNRMLSYFEQFKTIINEKISDAVIDHDLFDMERKKYDFYLDRLTERERDVFKQLLLGKTNIQIAEALCLSMGTVKNYVSSIYDKTGIKERNYLILKFSRFAVNHDQSNNRL